MVSTLSMLHCFVWFFLRILHQNNLIYKQNIIFLTSFVDLVKYVIARVSQLNSEYRPWPTPVPLPPPPLDNFQNDPPPWFYHLTAAANCGLRVPGSTLKEGGGSFNNNPQIKYNIIWKIHNSLFIGWQSNRTSVLGAIIIIVGNVNRLKMFIQFIE